MSIWKKPWRACSGTAIHSPILMLDLDRFKSVNDSLGHPIGDGLLKAVAGRLSACARETDVVARLGGDEFAILMTAEKDQRASAIIMAERLLEAVAAPYDIDGHEINIGTSIGIALAPEHGADVDQVIKNADLALYKAKSDGRSTYCLFEIAMAAEAEDRHALEIDLRNALTQDEFELHYHPIVDIKTMEAVSVECLARWRHPQRGLIAPDGFHSACRRDRSDQPARGMGLAQGVHRRHELAAAHQGCGQSVAGAVPGRRFG